MAEPSVAVRTKVDKVIAFVDASEGALPRERSEDGGERALAIALRDLKIRCERPIRGGSRPSTLKLTPSEFKYFGLIAAAQAKWTAHDKSFHRHWDSLGLSGGGAVQPELAAGGDAHPAGEASHAASQLTSTHNSSAVQQIPSKEMPWFDEITTMSIDAYMLPGPDMILPERPKPAKAEDRDGEDTKCSVVVKSIEHAEEGLRIFILQEKYLQLVLEGVKTLEIRHQKRAAGPAYIGTSTPPRVYAQILLGEPFQIKTVEHWRELANKHRASDFKGPDKLPYAKTMAFPILEVHKLEGPLSFSWKQGCVGYAIFYGV